MVFVILYLVLSILGLVLIKLGGEYQITLTSSRIAIELSWKSILGFISYILSFLLFTSIIPRYKLSYISPLTIGITQITIFLIAIFLFKEKINIYQIFGAIIIAIGLILINIGR